MVVLGNSFIDQYGGSKIFESALTLYGSGSTLNETKKRNVKQTIERNKKVKDQSHDPDVDGGFAWAILVASFVGHVLQYGVVWTVGVFYVVFLEIFDAGNGAVAMISSLNTAVYYLTGPLAAMLTNRYGCRTVAFVGSVIGSLGLITSMFATSIYHLYITFGILSGFGLGLAYIPTISTVGFYFEKKRNMATGIACSGIGVGTFLFPPIIRFLIEQFGWRGTLLMVGGICFNLCVCAALYRPKAPKMINEKEKIVAPSEKTGIFSVTIFKNTPYLFLCINNFLVCFGLSTVYVHLSSFAVSKGFSENQGAILFSTLGISNFFGRLLYGFAAQVPSLKPTILYTTSFFMSGLATVACTLNSSYAGMVIYAAFFGATTGAFGSLLPPLIIEMLDINFLTLGYGYIMVFEAMGTLLGGPVAGWIYDATKLYQASLSLGGAAMTLGGVFMVYPTWKSQKTRQDRTTASIVDIINEPSESYFYVTSV